MIPDSSSPMTAGGFFRFYLPLVATSYLLTATNPVAATNMLPLDRLQALLEEVLAIRAALAGSLVSGGVR